MKRFARRSPGTARPKRRWFRALVDLRIAGKLALAFVMVVVGVIGMCGVVFWSMDKLDRADRLAAGNYALVDAVDQTQIDMLDQMATTRAYVLTPDPQLLTREKDSRDKFDRDLAAAVVAAQSQPQLLPMLEALKTSHAAWQASLVDPQIKFAADPATKDKAVASVRSSLSRLMEKDIRGKATVVFRAASAWSATQAETATSATAMIKLAIVGGGGLAVGLSILMGWVLSRAIARPVLAMTSAMSALAAGDLAIDIPAAGRADELGRMAAAVRTFKDSALAKLSLERDSSAARETAERDRGAAEVRSADAARRQAAVVSSLALGLERLAAGDLVFRLTDSFAGEYEQLRVDFNVAIDRLRDTMAEVLRDAAAIRSGTDEISSASDDLARRTEQQAASLEETAAALDEITATVRKTTEGAVYVRGVVASAKTDAELSGRVVRQAIEAMGGIEKSSGEIGKIIGVIDEIAFQTNLLALNAGVEAARAGDAGRGFAVVASEVRALAQRSAQAAREIKVLVANATGEVDRGVDLVSQTGVVLDRILAKVAEVNGIVADIAASAQEQTVSLDQVNGAINQMDQVTQQNAAMVEQTTAASHTLARETTSLVALIGRFKVEASVPSAGVGRASRHDPMPVVATRAVGRGRAVRPPKPAPSTDWQEF